MTAPKAASIDDHWLEVQRGLAVVARKAPADWTPDSIRESCRKGDAFLFRVPEGFFILRPLANPVRVHVQVAYGNGGGLIQRYEPHIENLARSIGATEITFDSIRPGYRRAMRHWTRNGNHYTRRIV